VYPDSTNVFVIACKHLFYSCCHTLLFVTLKLHVIAAYVHARAHISMLYPVTVDCI